MKIQSSQTNRRFRGMARGFSLFEMVIVMGIIGVILGGVIFSAKNFGNTSRLQRVDSDFTSIEGLLEGYRMLSGYGYPTESQGLDALVKKPASAPTPRRYTPAVDKVPEDPWGTPYGYHFPGRKNTNDPEIVSAGPDKKFGSEDDLSSQD